MISKYNFVRVSNKTNNSNLVGKTTISLIFYHYRYEVLGFLKKEKKSLKKLRKQAFTENLTKKKKNNKF